MKLAIFLVSVVFSYMLFSILTVYYSTDISICLAVTLLGCISILLIPKPKFDDIEIIEVGRDFEQEARINKTRIASQKRKLNKAKHDNKKPNK